MKIKLIHKLFVVALLAVGCASNAQQVTKPDTVSTKVTPKSSIKSENGQMEITSGDHTVFEIQLTNGGDPRIDARINTGLIFEIAADQTDFEISNWDEHAAFVEISGCRCADRGYNTVISGTIKGTLLENGHWKIDADVTAKGKDSGEDRTFQFKGVIPGKSAD